MARTQNSKDSLSCPAFKGGEKISYEIQGPHVFYLIREGVKKNINYPGGIFHGRGVGLPPIHLNN